MRTPNDGFYSAVLFLPVFLLTLFLYGCGCVVPPDVCSGYSDPAYKNACLRHEAHECTVWLSGVKP